MSDASKLTNQRVKVADGYFCDQKLRVGGFLFLKELTGKGFEVVAKEIISSMEKQKETPDITGVMLSVRPILLSLMHQSHPDATTEELERAFGRVEIDQFLPLFNRLKIFEDSKKNAQGPAAKKKRQRQPVKKK